MFENRNKDGYQIRISLLGVEFGASRHVPAVYPRLSRGSSPTATRHDTRISHDTLRFFARFIIVHGITVKFLNVILNVTSSNFFLISAQFLFSWEFHEI